VSEVAATNDKPESFVKIGKGKVRQKHKCLVSNGSQDFHYNRPPDNVLYTCSFFSFG